MPTVEVVGGPRDGMAIDVEDGDTTVGIPHVDRRVCPVHQVLEPVFVFAIVPIVTRADGRLVAHWPTNRPAAEGETP